MALDDGDFFICFSSIDLAYAAAIDAALRAENFETFYQPRDSPQGNNPIWMDHALRRSVQILALYSPDYMKDTAIYSRVERYASWLQGSGNDQRKLIPVLLRNTNLTPLMAAISPIDVMGLTPKEAAARVIERLKAVEETEQRQHWRWGGASQIFRVPHEHCWNFIGRFEDLEKLHRSLSDHATVGVTAITGPDGIGKTTLASEYCHLFRHQYGGVWTIRARETTVMLDDLQELAVELGVGTGQNTEIDANAALDRLRAEPNPWLLLYEDAPNPDAVRRWLPAGAVRCLITSRFAEFGDLAVVLRLNPWPVEVTTEYLLHRTSGGKAAPTARLVQKLGGLPLAAEQAGTYLTGRYPEISFDRYERDIARLIRRDKGQGKTGDYPDTVYGVFVKALETLPDMPAGELALDLLRLCAFLSPDCIELALFTAGWSELPSDLATAMIDEPEEPIYTLNALTLLQWQWDSDRPDTIAVLVFHRLLLDVVRDWMGAEARAAWCSAAVGLVNSVFPDDVADYPSEWPHCRRLMPHVAALKKYAPQAGVAGESLDRLLDKARVYLDARGDRRGGHRAG